MWLLDPQCYVCGSRIETVLEATVEHVIPRSRGGRDDVRWCAASHGDCNWRRGDDVTEDDWAFLYRRWGWSSQPMLSIVPALASMVGGFDEPPTLSAPRSQSMRLTVSSCIAANAGP